MVEYIYNNDIEQVMLNKPYILYKDNISLQECLINNSRYHKYGAVYSKSLILNNDIITFQMAGPILQLISHKVYKCQKNGQNYKFM